MEHGALAAKMDAKVMQKVPRETPRVRNRMTTVTQRARQKVSKKVTENDHKLYHLATDCPKAIPGGPREPFGVPPHGSQKTDKSTTDKKRKTKQTRTSVHTPLIKKLPSAAVWAKPTWIDKTRTSGRLG